MPWMVLTGGPEGARGGTGATHRGIPRWSPVISVIHNHIQAGQSGRPREPHRKGRYNMSKKRYSANNYSDYLAFLQNPKAPDFETICQIGNKQAWVVYDRANELFCLQSYWTIVSVQVGNEAHHLGHWSSTTGRHQSEFARSCPYTR